MKRFEITLKSPISARNLAKIITAMDVIHDAEFAFRNNQFPQESNRLYLTMSYGSFKIEGFGGDDGAVGGLLAWLKEKIDPDYRKLLMQEIEKRDMENRLLQAKVEVSPIHMKEKELDLEMKKIQIADHTLNLLDRMVEISDKVSNLSPLGQHVLINLKKSVLVIADAREEGIISYISELRD